MLRHIWTICSSRDSLWSSWCSKNLLRKKDFWQVKEPLDCSWTWRKILKLRGAAQKISKYKIGDGQATSLWFSNWHPFGPLIPKYGSRVAYDAAIAENSKVSAVIKEGRWAWPFPTTWELREIVHSIEEQPDQTKPDEFIWTASKTKEYTQSSTWKSIRQRHQQVPWYKLVWFSNNIPKHSFILWTAIKKKLNTKDKLVRWGTLTNDTCELCKLEAETMDHLYFECCYSRQVWKDVNKLCGFARDRRSWSNEVHWAVGKFSKKTPESCINKIAWTAMIYNIWIERNARVFGKDASSAASLVDKIKHEVRLKALQIRKLNPAGVLDCCSGFLDAVLR